jgi:TRAP-type C4-dicarboxylate transport system permease small subunit
VSFLLVVSGVALVRLTNGQHSPALDVPMSWVYAAVPVSGLLMLIHLIGGSEGDAE